MGYVYCYPYAYPCGMAKVVMDRASPPKGERGRVHGGMGTRGCEREVTGTRHEA
jgi:hypothetical protein